MDFFMIIVRDVMERYPFKLHAYCLMLNHYHMLIETTDTEIWHIMKRISQLYTGYFNTKYERDGSVFRGRYKAIEVNGQSYFMQVSRYICLNPVKANIVTCPEDYKWSSFATMIGIADDQITECAKTLDQFQENARENYCQFVSSDLD